MTKQVYFGILDYVLLSVMLCGSIAIGLYFSFAGKRQRTKEEYLLGGRRMTAVPVCLSLFATFQSAISLLGTPNEVYSYGTMYIYDIIATSLSNLLAIFTVVPLVYQLKITSVNEYLGQRFDSTCVQMVGSLLCILSTVSYMTIALLSPALALEPTVGIPLWLSIIIVGVVGTVYTSIGGIKSVIWADAFQTIFVFGGAFTVLVKGTIDVGGIEKVWDIAHDTGRISFDEVSFDPRVRHTIWGFTFGAMIYWYSSFYTQSSVQRILSTRSVGDVRKVYIFSIFVFAGYSFILVMTGLVLTAYIFVTKCDPLEAGFIANNNQLVPYFVLLTLRFVPGLSGLYISTIFSASLSTLSSGINAMAANTVEDFISKIVKNKSEAVMTTITKILVCCYGIACIGLAYLAKELQGPVTQMAFMAVGAVAGPMLGMFILGASFPQANHIGVLAGCGAGVAVSFGLSSGALKYGHPTPTLQPGPTDFCSRDNVTALMKNYSSISPTQYVTSAQSLSNATPPASSVLDVEGRGFSIFDISYIWHPALGVFTTISVGLLVSLITNQFISRRSNPDAKYLYPLCRKFWYRGNNVRGAVVEMDDMDDNK